MTISNLRAKTLLVSGSLLLAGFAWLLYELTHPAPASRLLHPESPAFALVITPGRALFALYAVLIGASLLPCLHVALALWLDRRAQDAARPARRRAYLTLLAAGLCVSSLLAGYAWEALHTEVRLTARNLEYRLGGQEARMAWQDIRAMRIRFRGQRLELRTADARMSVDLTTFSLPDRLLMVSMVPRVAHLTPLPRAGGEEQVWRRSLPQIAPEP